MLALTFEILNATLGTLIGQIKTQVEQADKAQKASLALGQSLGGLTKQLTISDKLQKNFNKSAKDSAARTESALRDVRKGTDELARSLNATTAKIGTLGDLKESTDKLSKSYKESTTKLGTDLGPIKDVARRNDSLGESLSKLNITMDRMDQQGSITRTSFSESVSKLNEDFNDLVSRGVIDRDKPIKELMVDQFRGDFTQRLGVVFEGLRAGIELDEINGSIGDLINEQMLLGGDVKGTAKSLAFLNTTMRMDTRQRNTLVETLRDTRDKFTVSIDTLVESVDAIKQFIPLFKSAGMESAVGGLVKAAGQLGPEMQQQFKDFAQLMFDPSFEAMQKRSILGVQGFTRAIQGLDEAGVQKAFMDAARQSSRVVDSMAGDLGTMIEGFSVPVNALGNVAYSIKALGEMDPRKVQKQIERANFADQISVLFDEILEPFDKVVFTELYGSIASFMRSLNTVLVPKVQEFSNKLSTLIRDPEAIARVFINIYNSMAKIANLFVSLASMLLNKVGGILDELINIDSTPLVKMISQRTLFPEKSMGEKFESNLIESITGPLKKQRDELKTQLTEQGIINKYGEMNDRMSRDKMFERAIEIRKTNEKGEIYSKYKHETMMAADGFAMLKDLERQIEEARSGSFEDNFGTVVQGVSQMLDEFKIEQLNPDEQLRIMNEYLNDIKENTEEPPDFAEPTMIMTESVKSLGDTLLAITLSNYDEERDIALASLKAQVDIANVIGKDIPPGPGATAIGGAR